MDNRTLVVGNVCNFYIRMGMDCYAQDKQTYTVKQSGFSVEELQKILNTASDTQEIEVIFEKGTYEITQCIYLRSNTTIYAQGATFVRSGTALVNGGNLLSNNAEGQTGTNRGSGYSLTKILQLLVEPLTAATLQRQRSEPIWLFSDMQRE